MNIEMTMNIVDILVKSGMADSKSKARKLIKQGAVKIYPPKNHKLFRLGKTIYSVKINEAGLT